MKHPLPKLSAPAQRALASRNIQSLEDLTSITKTQLSKLHGLGPSTLKSLEAAMKEYGVNYAKE